MPNTDSAKHAPGTAAKAIHAGAMRNVLGIISEDRTKYRPEALRKATSLGASALETLTGIHRVTLYKKEVPLKPSAKLTKRIFDVVLATDLAYELFGENHEETRTWLTSPNTYLFGASPFQVCFRGEGESLIRWLNQLLGRTPAPAF